MSKPEHGLGPKHLLFNCGQAGRRGFHFVSLILTGPKSAETQPSSGGSTGKLIYLLFLTLQIRDRTEQKRPGILGTWQHYLHTIHNVLNTLKMFGFRSKFNTSSVILFTLLIHSANHVFMGRTEITMLSGYTIRQVERKSPPPKSWWNRERNRLHGTPAGIHLEPHPGRPGLGPTKRPFLIAE